MKLLLAFDQRHPAIAATIGGTSGLTAWLIAHSSEITSLAGVIGGTATAAIAVLSLARLIFLGIVWLLAQRRAWHSRRAQRRTWKRHDPADDHLEF